IDTLPETKASLALDIARKIQDIANDTRPAIRLGIGITPIPFGLQPSLDSIPEKYLAGARQGVAKGIWWMGPRLFGKAPPVNQFSQAEFINQQIAAQGVLEAQSNLQAAQRADAL